MVPPKRPGSPPMLSFSACTECCRSRTPLRKFLQHLSQAIPTSNRIMAKTRPTSANKGDQIVQLRYRDAVRINNAVLAHESGRRSRNPSALPRAAGAGGGGEGGVATATFSGSWLHNTYKVVYKTSSPSTATASVLNTLGDISGVGAAATRTALVAFGSPNLLVNYEC